MRVFDDYDCIKIGLQFGTLSVSIRGEIFEVTTFRSDGEYFDVFFLCIPELSTMIGFDQNNKYHVYDLYGHTVCALESCSSSDLVLRLAVFFHDFEKPYSYQDGEDGYRHFEGHGKVGASIVDSIMQCF